MEAPREKLARTPAGSLFFVATMEGILPKTEEEIQACRDDVARCEDRLHQAQLRLSEATGGESDFLRPLTLRDMLYIDGGRVAKEFDQKVHDIYLNISRYPCVMNEGEVKVSGRQLSLQVEVTPDVKLSKMPVESANSAVMSHTPVIRGLDLSVVVGSKVPAFKASGIKMITRMKGGRLTDAFFNPNNNENPAQQEFDFEDEDE